MSAERIDGIKYHLDREPDEVVLGLQANLLDKHRRLMGDIERVTGVLAVRGLVPTPEREDHGQLELDMLGDRPPLERGDIMAGGAHPLQS